MDYQTIEVKTEMLIRRPVAEVFEAFIDPAVTSQFWFTKGDGRLEAGKQVRWDWEMYGASTTVNVKTIEANALIVIEWGDEGDRSTVEWRFTERSPGETFVVIRNTGFQGDDETVVRSALDSMGGFTIVLAGAKAYLEHGIRLNLIADKYPDAVVEEWNHAPG